MIVAVTGINSLAGQVRNSSIGLVNNRIVENFLWSSHLQTIRIVLHPSTSYGMYYLLYGFIGIIALIHFIAPYRIPQIISNAFVLKNIKKRVGEGTYFSTGLGIPLFFSLNFLLMLSLLIYLLLRRFVPNVFFEYSNLHLFITICGFVFIYFFGYRFTVSFVNFMLGTKMMTTVHLRFNNNTEYFIGIFLLPILFLFLYTSVYYMLIIAVLFLVGMFVYKWFQIFILGFSVARLNPYHLFLYLCTLEFLPLLVLIKVSGFDKFL